MQIITIGLDVAKGVFQLHRVDAQGQVALQRRLWRSEVERFFARLPPALVGIEACGSAHHWARLLTRLGHDVRRCRRPIALPSGLIRGSSRTCRSRMPATRWT